MRPIIPQPRVSDNHMVRAGGYRAFTVIGATVITLCVIGTAGGLLVSKFSNKFIGRDSAPVPGHAGPDLDRQDLIIKLNDHGYYQGLLGQLRSARIQESGSSPRSGRDTE